MIKKIVIEINKKTIEFTPEQAKELYFELDKLFGPRHTYYPIYPYYPVTKPYVWYGTTWYGTTYTSSGGDTITYTAT
jgi:hypothetical protein